MVMYGCESWIIKKAERQRIDAFELCSWRRLLRVPWTARRSNQSILKKISPGYSLERLMLKLKLQYFGHPMWRADSLEKTLMLAKIEGRRRRGRKRTRWLDGITNSMDMGFSGLWGCDGQGDLVCCGSWDCKESDMTEWLNWTECLLQCLTHIWPLTFSEWIVRRKWDLGHGEVSLPNKELGTSFWGLWNHCRWWLQPWN